MRGFEAAAGLVRAQIRTAGEARGFALSRLLTHWAEIVGEDLARAARPVRIGYGRQSGGLGATLTLLVSGSAAPVVQMQLPAIREKVNGCYGYNAISRVTITQTAASGFAEEATPYRAPQPAANPAAVAEAHALSREVHDETLRAALEALGEKVLSRTRKT